MASRTSSQGVSPSLCGILVLTLSFISSSRGQVPLPPISSHSSIAAGSTQGPVFAGASHGVPLPPASSHGAGGRSHSFRFATKDPTDLVFSGSSGVPLSATSAQSPRGGVAFTPGGSRAGVPLPSPTSSSAGGTRTSVSQGPGVGTVGKGILETQPQGTLGIGFRSTSPGLFHINGLPSSIELDKKLSPVPPYFVFSDDDTPKRTLSIGGPKTGGLLPISNPTTDPKLLRLLSQPVVRQRLVAEAGADKALKISAILMAHRQVVGGQITYASLRVSETNCPANRVNSLHGCNVDRSQDSYICEVAFWERPWLNVTRILDEKTGCAETESDVDFDADDSRERGRVIEGEEVGGVWTPSPALPAGVTQQQLAVEAFNYVDSHSDSNFRGYLAGHSVHSVLSDTARNLTKVQVWVDYGFTVCLKLDWTMGGQKDPRNCPVDTTRAGYSCALSLLYHPHHLMPLRVAHGDDKDELKCTKKLTSTTRATASSFQGATSQTTSLASGVTTGAAKELESCPGCPVQAALSDPAILSMLNFAIDEFDELYSDDHNLHKPVSLISAYTQASAGTKYLLTVEVAETVCVKGVVGTQRSQCARDPTEENEICVFVVLHQPWLPSSHLLSAKCFDMDEAHRHNPAFLLSSSVFHAQSNAAPGAGSAAGTALPGLQNLKPVTLSLSGSSSSSGTATPPLDARTSRVVQFVVDQVNRREVHDDRDWDSRGRDDSREFDDDFSRELDDIDSDDGYYELVKVHKVLPLTGGGQQRVVLELGETNCSRAFLPRANARYCALDPFEEHEVCDAIVQVPSSGAPLRLLSVTCEDLGDYLGQSSLVPPVPSVTWVPAPFLPVGHLGAATGPQTATGFSSTATGQYAGMQAVSTSDPLVQKAGELVVARYNLLSDEDELARLAGVVTAHTLSSGSGPMRYLLEVEMSETTCKKYLPIVDQNKCPVDPTEDRIVCQAEVTRDATQTGQAAASWDGLSAKKLYCREKDDYVRARTTGEEGPWAPMSPTDPKLKQLTSFIADQFDLRTDDDNLFVAQRTVSARYQNVSGIRYNVVVELAETVCPKYKEHINKDRCRVDITEDVKLCNAFLFEPPSGVSSLQVTKLLCKDKHDSTDIHSAEVAVLPSVHPSAHARPVFLNKFKKPTFRIRVDESGESLESNEFIADTVVQRPLPPKPVVRFAQRLPPPTVAPKRHLSRESMESNEQFYRNPRVPGLRSSRPAASGRRHDSRSEEDESDEFLPRSLRVGRRRRSSVASARVDPEDLTAQH